MLKSFRNSNQSSSGQNFLHVGSVYANDTHDREAQKKPLPSNFCFGSCCVNSLTDTLIGSHNRDWC